VPPVQFGETPDTTCPPRLDAAECILDLVFRLAITISARGYEHKPCLVPKALIILRSKGLPRFWQSPDPCGTRHSCRCGCLVLTRSESKAFCLL